MMILEKMNLDEVINPHYAFPIVGVILCALLVFAFGFKTPAQPPSFDFEEHRKATGKKKQKTKEKPKVVQNGSTPPQKSVTNVRSQPEVEQPAPIIEKQTNKNEAKTKVKKSTVVAQQQPAQSEPKPVASTEDTSSGGQWTQQLSKKDRKNRKKEEPETKSKAESSPSKSKRKPAKEVTNSVVEPVAKDDTPPPAVETKPDSEVPAKEQRESKKKTPKTETKPLDAEPLPPTPPACVSSAGSNDQNKEKKVEEVKAKVVEQPPPKPIETKPPPVVPPPADAGTNKSSATENVKTEENGSSNVVFDELGDMWQDSKPQKKKKKARRE